MKQLTEAQREACRRGGLARAKQFTRDSQRRARRSVSSEACAANGRKGAQATISRHGMDKLFAHWQRWKQNNPSMPELLMIGLLSTLKVKFEREWRVGNSLQTLDFYLPELNLGIEVHGRIHQTLDAEARARRDETKRASLDDLGVRVLWVNDSEFENVAALAARLMEFLGLPVAGGHGKGQSAPKSDKVNLLNPGATGKRMEAVAPAF